MMEKLNYGMGALALDEFAFKLCSWNINGSANAEYRKEVLSKTFEKVLLPCEIICLQEVPFNPSRDSLQHKMREYIPQLADSFGVIHVRETAGGGIYNAVLFDERKFKDCSTETSFKDAIEKAYQLMEKKCEIYRSLSSLDDDRRTAQLSTYLSMQNSLEYEVAIECNECGGGFKEALKRYSKKHDMPGFIRSPKDILQGRVAFSLLKASGRACNHLIVLSVHALNQEAVDFAYLLFDFLRKFDFYCPMLIAGDFNCHITKIPDVGRFLKDYDIPHYELRPLRGGARIDFIMKGREPRNVAMTNLSAHDFILPDVGTQEANAAISIEMQRTYTNHSPLTVKVTVN